MLFKNYSLTEVIYLLIRSNKTKFFPRNTKTTDRNDVNKLNTHAHTKHSKKDNTGGRGGGGCPTMCTQTTKCRVLGMGRNC